MSITTPMPDVLSAIVASARKSAAERAAASPLADLIRAAGERSPMGEQFASRLRAPGIRVIAECKRRSPSRGVLCDAYDPATIAAGYEAAGAAAISVLTEPTFFDGAMAHLTAVRDAVRIPVLRKDFIVSEYQLVEARAIGADAALLIVAALDQVELEGLLRAARDLELAALVEVHNGEELQRAVAAGAGIIGINSRNLRTLAVDSSIFDSLVHGVPAETIVVAESGLTSADELRRLQAAGFDAFLMGERFMTTPDPGASLAALRHAAEEVER